MDDPFQSAARKVTDPARKVWLIAPHATNEVTPVPTSIRADNAGTICFRAVDSDTDVTMTFAAGESIDVRAQFIRAIGTTVTVIHGLRG